MKKCLASLFAIIFTFSTMSMAYASEKSLKDSISLESLVKVNEHITEVTGAENSDELLLELDLESRKAGGQEFDALNGNMSTLSASYCTSQCQKSYRYDTKNGSNGKANIFSSAGGYHWNNGIVHWTGVHGGSSATWDGTGTAQFIKIDHILTYRGSVITVSNSMGFSGSGDSRTWTGEKKYNTNSHLSQFAGGSASSGIMLNAVVHEGSALVRGSDGNDYRPIGVVSID